MMHAETRYSEIEKLALALVVSCKKLRPYFQAHTIVVSINQPLKQMLHKPDLSGRLVKWAVELEEFDIIYKPRSTIKGQALADFVAEFTYNESIYLLNHHQRIESNAHPPEPSVPTWELYVDGSSNMKGSGAGLVLITPPPHQAIIEYALRFGFHGSNNEAEYEALLAGLPVAATLGPQKIVIYSDSQLVVNQVTSSYQAKEDRMAAYLRQVHDMLKVFGVYFITQVPRSANLNTDLLTRLASTSGMSLRRTIPV